jgi:hypothetical protein
LITQLFKMSVFDYLDIDAAFLCDWEQERSGIFVFLVKWMKSAVKSNWWHHFSPISMTIKHQKSIHNDLSLSSPQDVSWALLQCIINIHVLLHPWAR